MKAVLFVLMLAMLMSGVAAAGINVNITGAFNASGTPIQHAHYPTGSMKADIIYRR